MKRLTYHNLLRGIRIMQNKGYDRETSERLARMQFDKLETDQTGTWTFERLAELVLDKADYDREFGPDRRGWKP